jgi:hypothetical protein
LGARSDRPKPAGISSPMNPLNHDDPNQVHLAPALSVARTTETEPESETSHATGAPAKAAYGLLHTSQPSFGARLASVCEAAPTTIGMSVTEEVLLRAASGSGIAGNIPPHAAVNARGVQAMARLSAACEPLSAANSQSYACLDACRTRVAQTQARFDASKVNLFM